MAGKLSFSRCGVLALGLSSQASDAEASRPHILAAIGTAFFGARNRSPQNRQSALRGWPRGCRNARGNAPRPNLALGKSAPPRYAGLVACKRAHTRPALHMEGNACVASLPLLWMTYHRHSRLAVAYFDLAGHALKKCNWFRPRRSPPRKQARKRCRTNDQTLMPVSI